MIISKVSDFKLVEAILKNICNFNGVPFSDVKVIIDKNEEDSFIDDAIYIEKSEDIAQTMYMIISRYIDSIYDIIGKEIFKNDKDKNAFTITVGIKLKDLLFNDKSIDIESTKIRLYQYPLVWIIMKNIICPINDINIKNISIINKNMPYIDIAKYYEKGYPLENESFIFLNNINNRIVQSAFLLYETIIAHGLSPIKTIKTIYENDLYEKFQGLLQLSMNDDEINIFEGILIDLVGINLYDLMPQKNKNMKTAQNLTPQMPGINTQWWFYGLTEQLLERVRGEDWSIYKDLEPVREEFWKNIEQINTKRVKEGHDKGVPFDILLRIKSHQTTGQITDPTETMQSLLHKKRIL